MVSHTSATGGCYMNSFNDILLVSLMTLKTIGISVYRTFVYLLFPIFFQCSGPDFFLFSVRRLYDVSLSATTPDL